MNYKAFYRRYRPNNFDQIVGQDHVVKTLVNIINMQKISHGYLFCGPRGTGKTSIARVFANAINCLHSEKLEDICHDCLDNAAKSLDVIEIDAASNNGVNDIRTIREQIKFVPTNHPYKIYIIDEVHMLSKGAFNALLMTLEEPPKHAIFILATTDPDKIPETVLSRVQRYNFKRINKTVLRSQLKYVFENEKIQFDEQALELIATLANGSLRDALSIADQISAYSNANISKKDIMDIFGLVAADVQVELINYLVNKNVGAALQHFDDLVSSGIDLLKFVVSLINLLKDFLVFKKTLNPNLIESCTQETIEKIQIKSDHVYKFLEILTPLSSEIKYSEIPHQLMHLAIIKLCSIEGSLKDLEFVKTDSFTIDQNQSKTDNLFFDDSDKIKDITSERFIQTNAQDFNSSTTTNLNNSSTKNSQTLLSDFSTQEVKKHFDDFFDENINSSSTSEELIINDYDDSTAQIQNQQTYNSKQSENSNFVDNPTETEAFSFQNTYGDADNLLEQATNIINMANEIDGSGIDVDETILLESSTEFNNPTQKEIYDTNEIDLTKPKDYRNLIDRESTEEFNILSKQPKTDLVKKVSNSKEYKLTQLNIINLFLLAERDSFEDFKKMLNKSFLSIDEKFNRFKTLLKNVKFICSAKNFILVSSNENWIVKDLKTFENDLKFHEFLGQNFGNKTHFFAITKEEYQEAKKLYIELKNSNNVPKAFSLPDKIVNDSLQNIEYDKHKETEMKAKALFGSLFKKRNH